MWHSNHEQYHVSLHNVRWKGAWGRKTDGENHCCSVCAPLCFTAEQSRMKYVLRVWHINAHTTDLWIFV